VGRKEIFEINRGMPDKIELVLIPLSIFIVGYFFIKFYSIKLIRNSSSSSNGGKKRYLK
jgi:hypothetical protein